MKVTDTTPIVERTFYVEMSGEELHHLRVILGDRTGADAERQRLDEALETAMWRALVEADEDEE